ncbi:MAG TPA: PAS domain-containing protein, partial [Steroidobacteraceae bacterium]
MSASPDDTNDATRARDATTVAHAGDPEEQRKLFIFRTVSKFTAGYLIEFHFDAAGRAHVAWASEGFEQIYGCSLEEYKRRRPGWCHPPESAAESAQRRAAVERGERVEGVKHVLRDDCTSRWLYIVIQPLRDTPTGPLTRAVGVAHDITHAVLGNHALRESQSTLESIASNSPDWLVLLDPQRRIRFINRPIFGVPPPQLIGKRIEDTALPRHRRHVRDFVQGVLDGRGRGEYLQTLQDPALGTRKLFMRARPVKVDDGVMGAVLTCTEVTEQVGREQMLRLQASVLAKMKEGVALIDRRGHIELCNAAFSAAFGAAAGALIGTRVTTLAKRLALKQRRGKSMEVDCTRIDGTRFTAQCLLAPIPFRDHHHALLVLSDITER